MAKTKRKAAHLKAHQFKKGVSGNPQGGKLHDPGKRILKNLTIEKYREVIELVLTNNVEAIKEMITDPEVSALQVAIATAFLRAIKEGDYDIVEKIAQRIIGKIPDELNINSKNQNANLNATIDPVKLKAAYDALDKDV